MYKLLVVIFAAFLTLPSLHSPALGRSMESGEALVARRGMAAVVSIATWKMHSPTKAGAAPRRVRVYASGFVVDPTGFIVTNKHVVDGALDLTVIFSDGNRVPARLVSAAAMIDLAVLKVDFGQSLPFLKWGNSDALEIGDPVLTIGNALGIGMSVSAGIVSALNRDLQDTPFDSYIQTDAAINHGNSGGPLINQDGDVVGVDTALYNPEANGGFIGIGFAIPSNTAKFVADRLLDPNHPKPGWLGFSLQDSTPELAAAFGVPQYPGAIISAVDPTGPASKASLRPGDVLEKINDAQLSDARAFMRAIVMVPVGKPVHLTVWRDGREQDVPATVAEWPNYMLAGGVMSAHVAQAVIAQAPDPGVRLAPITDASRKQYGLDAKLTGALVSSVEVDCEARDLGIVPGDVITAAQGEAVSSPDDVRRAVKKAHEQRRQYLAVLIQGKRGARWVSLSIGGAGA
jgi:serine protease Do